MPKTKTHKGAAKRFSVTGTGKIMRRRRHRTTPPGHLVKSSPGRRKRAQQDTQVARSDRGALRKMLGI